MRMWLPNVRLEGFAAMLWLLAVAASVLGCGWSAGTDHSVRFNPYRAENEFWRLPPLPRDNAADKNKLFSWVGEIGEGYYEDRNKGLEKANEVWKEAGEAEHRGRLGDLLRLLREYLQLTNAEHGSKWEDKEDLQRRRNSAFDRIDALGALDQGASASEVRAYLTARRAFDDSGSRDEVLKPLEEARSDNCLRDNAEYLHAALRQQGDEQAATDFEKLAARYPLSEKREAALFMSALLTAKQVESLERYQDSNIDGDEGRGHRAQVLRAARAKFEFVMREYPQGRLYADAQGWLGRLWLEAGDRARALVEYYRMLGSRDAAGRIEAISSLALVRSQADESEMERVEKALAREPSAALAYAYHNIYNYASQSVHYECWEDCDKKTQRRSRELKRIASFATRMIDRGQTPTLSAAFVLRVAESNLELNDHTGASKLSRRALAMGVTGEHRAEALWVAGVSGMRLGQYYSARPALEILVAENPDNRYTEGARRILAMLAEDTGDVEGALDQYLALDYRYDVAYFVDVLMTPEQLAAFIDSRPLLANRDQMLYALGVRYLRERRWKDGRATLAKVKTVGRNVDEDYFYRRHDYRQLQYMEDECPKVRDFDRANRGVRPQWIDQDLRTANDVERLERQVETAQSDEARAEALYQVASYQFERSLLFYNPLEWQHIRHYLLYDLDQRGAFRRAGESQKLFDYMQKHDMAANSLSIFLEVVRRFPNTRAARDALYTAAVCHERLREYNAYWREVYDEGGHAGERMVVYNDVRSVYPGYRFPRGTLGWEPSTRTVNGGPGWDKLPKTMRRPSRWARGADLLIEWMNQSFKLWNRLLTDFEFLIKQTWLAIVGVVEWFFHWLWIASMLGWLWFLWNRSAEARDLLGESLAQCEPRPEEERGNSHLLVNTNEVSSKIDEYLGQDLRDKCLEMLLDLSYKLERIGESRRGRALIAYYAATHGLFVILFLRLLVNR